MKNILFLTESFSAKASPNGNCVKKITDLMSADNNVNVIALKSDAELPRYEIINKTKVHRINTYFSWRLAYFFKSRRNPICRVLEKLNRIFKCLLSYYTPFRAPLVLHSYVKTGKKIILTEKIDVIVAVYKDFEDTYAGIILKKKFPNVKLMIYCLDAIRGGVIENTIFGENRAKKSIAKWEEKFFNSADVICLMQSHKGFYSDSMYDKYRNKFTYVDIPLLNIKEKSPKTIKSDCINFVFTGMIAPHLADPRYFLEVMKIIIKQKKIVFNIYGGITDEIRDDILNDELYNKNVFFHGRKTQEELVGIREEADVFLSFGNYHECGIPCKIFEYISELKPVINFYKIEKDAARPYIFKYGMGGMNIDQNESPQVNAERIIDFLDSVDSIVIEKRTIEKDFEQNMPVYMIKEILKTNRSDSNV